MLGLNPNFVMQINATTPVFLMGLGIGTGLLVLGIALGFFMGRKAGTPSVSSGMDPQQFLLFMHNLSKWTNEVSGDVSKYQTQLNTLSRRVEVDSSNASKEEVQLLLQQIMQANHQLQSRLDSAEVRLENQTKEIASYLTEARTDGLTGLSNRRAFDQQLDEQFRSFAQTKKPFALALIDIDHFKKINDTHGHPAGDAVLREMSSRLRMHVVDPIQIARYGGEEFAIVLGLPLDKAAAAIDQLRMAVAATPIDAEGKKLQVSISCGVAEVMPEERIGKLVRRSDEALYSAKLGGRNRVYKHDGKLCLQVGNPPPPLADAARQGELNSDGLESGIDPSIEAKIQQKLSRIVAEESKR